MAKRCTPWEEVRARYETEDCTYRQLAEEYGVSIQSIWTHAQKECAAVSALVYALAGVLQEKGQLARGDIREGYADIAGAGDCAREFALVRCGLEMLAGQYPESVEIGS